MNAAGDIPELKRALNNHARAVVEHLLPAGKLDRREWRAGSTAGDEGQSLKVSLTGEWVGTWKDFATDERGDLISLWMSCRRLRLPEALEEIQAWLGLPKDTPPTPAQRRSPPPGPTASPPSDSWRLIWRDAAPLPGTVAERYLRNRGCEIPVGGDLRYLAPSPRYPWPTMVGLVTDFVTGTPMSLHFTALAIDGSGKAPIEKPKRLLAGHRKAGGVIRLTDDADVTTELGIGEGIETSLAVAKALGPFRPMWCAIDAGNLAELPVVAGIERLVVYADTDRSGTGQTAARKLAARWHGASREVFIAQPSAPRGGKSDWNEAAE
ncbi:DUF7146 domain-containing protein [Reyranella sp.]|uniref:DUF7146 domain-containing protein n=1 Tax=Reyranella sp. TaxID=1929291 RepID=UPI003D1418A8